MKELLSAASAMGQAPSSGTSEKKEVKKENKRFEAPPPPTRVGKKQRKRAGDASSRLPVVTPNTKCKLRLLKLERVKDYLLMEEEFVANQERLKPQETRNEEDRSKVDELRGSPLSVGNLEEIIDDRCVVSVCCTLMTNNTYEIVQPRNCLFIRWSRVLCEHLILCRQGTGALVASSPAKCCLTRKCSLSPAVLCFCTTKCCP